MNILLVEPDVVLGEAIKSAFKNAKNTVNWKRSAQTALDSLDLKIPDLIVIEIQLGLHNGIEFLYEIQSYPEWQNIPIIIHTLNANVLDDQFAKAFSELQVKALLYKPRTSTLNLLRISSELVKSI